MTAQYNDKLPVKFTDSHATRMPIAYVVAFTSDAEHRVVATLTIYATAQRKSNFAQLMVRLKGSRAVRSSGRARGCGYHRASAAVENAMINAGFTFAEPWGGSGDTATLAAFRAVVLAAGYATDQFFIHSKEL